MVVHRTIIIVFRKHIEREYLGESRIKVYLTNSFPVFHTKASNTDVVDNSIHPLRLKYESERKKKILYPTL